MQQHEIATEVSSRLHISDLLAARAETFLRGYRAERVINTWDLVREFCETEGNPDPGKLDISTAESVARAIQVWASHASHYVAAVEGTWRLIHTGHFLPESDGLNHVPLTFSYQNRNEGGALNPHPLEPLRLPQRISIAPSRIATAGRPTLVLPEELISALAEGDAHTEVIEAAKDALDCFSHGLYRPALVMLGKAAEGTWIELTLEAAKLAGDTKTEADLLERPVMFQRMVKTCRDLLTRPEVYEAIKDANVRTQDIDEAQVWTDTLRLSRNAIHFRATPDAPNTYEKAAVMILAGVGHFGTLCQARTAIRARMAQS